MENGIQKLSVREKIGYGLGDTASNLFFQVTIYFASFFYTDVFGIEAKTAGTMFLVTRVWDAINDPIMGAVSYSDIKRAGMKIMTTCENPANLQSVLKWPGYLTTCSSLENSRVMS